MLRGSICQDGSESRELMTIQEECRFAPIFKPQEFSFYHAWRIFPSWERAALPPTSLGLGGCSNVGEFGILLLLILIPFCAKAHCLGLGLILGMMKRGSNVLNVYRDHLSSESVLSPVSSEPQRIGSPPVPSRLLWAPRTSVCPLFLTPAGGSLLMVIIQMPGEWGYTEPWERGANRSDSEGRARGGG